VEGLGQVVLAAGGEAGQPVDDVPSRGEEQDGCGHAAGTKGLADVTPIGIRKSDIENRRVELAGHGGPQRAGTVHGGSHREALSAQPSHQDVPKVVVVLHHEHPRLHVTIIVERRLPAQ
jgi:hypothetical protein